jgi:hypothetical protein
LDSPKITQPNVQKTFNDKTLSLPFDGIIKLKGLKRRRNFLKAKRKKNEWKESFFDAMKCDGKYLEVKA